jgi:phenylacetate-CoA ligase
MILQLANKAYGSATILARLPGQKRFPFRPREQVIARRDAAVRAIVVHAATTVPYYRELFRRERIDPHDIRNADDLARLPLLEKSVVRSDPERFRSESRAGRTALRFVTSGTTGAPLVVWHDRGTLLTNIAYGERERAVIVRACGAGPRPREMLLAQPRNTLRRLWDFYEGNALLPVRPRRAQVSVLDPLDEVVRAIDGSKPHALTGYGSFLELLFRYVDTRGIAMHVPKLIVYIAETMTAPGRAFIEERFNVPVLSRYNAIEAFKIGFVCEERIGFHVHEDLCHVRIVRSDGTPVGDGEAGEVVLSNLVNRATVLLNYRMGDLASWCPERCGCGRTLGRLRDLDGRREDILRMSDGRVVHPRAVWGILREQTGLLRYQLVQSALNRFELRLVTRDASDYERIVPAAVAGMRQLFGASAELEIARADGITPADGGKFRPVVCRC